MFFSAIIHLLLSSVLTRDIGAKPLASPRVGRVISLDRSSRKTHLRPMPHPSSTLPLFYPDPFITRECRGLRRKYLNVSDNLALPSGFEIVSTDSEAPFIPPVVIAPHVFPLKDYYSENTDLEYYGIASFGTPKQGPFSIDIDTGSADLWIPNNCTECKDGQFKDTKSSTCKRTDKSFSVCYGSGEVSGILMQDVVSMAGLKVYDQFFGAVYEISDDFLGLPTDGLMGMAFSSVAQSGERTFFENLLYNNMLPARIFSVYLARNQEDGSELCFGCFDTTKALGAVRWVKLLSKTYWSVPMNRISVNDTALIDVELIAIIDTGTTLVYFPDDVASDFYSTIPGSKPAPQYGSEFYTYPCSAPLDIQFWFGGQSFDMSNLDFNLGMTALNSPDCVGGILSLDSDGFPPNLAIIGDEFLKSHYTTFDYDGRVGFAPSINNKN
ncbi:aspartic peptidase domain-containing protein [Roridomyces roridus]|uniref:Aspartic peptidase domain-containing protein n=1 Tax=Roridomyces roridus TaxID=1738132 RepID=A0AAD7G0J1_9AGAR|nr:aspartic peptidase domain-containing protein [Roridomyces roridus]